MKNIVLALATSLALAVPAGVAMAGDRDVIREGPCSASSDWKLKLSPENGRVEVEFEVDQNVVGDRWRVKILHDGDRAFAGTRTRRGASGSFELRIVEDDRVGADTFRARARNSRPTRSAARVRPSSLRKSRTIARSLPGTVGGLLYH